MLKKCYLVFVAPFLALSVISLTGCSNQKSNADMVLRILNSEDYIYEYEKGDEENFENDESLDESMQNKNAFQMDMVDQFELDWERRHPGQDLEVVYDTFDTNETMFNELKTGKTTYDVLVPSDYMVQKLASLDMLHKIPSSLWENISPKLIELMSEIKIPDENGNEIPGSTLTDFDYCIPYMWGTLGIMYNVDYYLKRLQEIDPTATEDDVHDLFKTWDCLYGKNAQTSDKSLKEKYSVISGTFSIKDSVRDTYTISLLHAFSDEVKACESSTDLRNIINKHDSETIAKVKDDMLNLKDNAFGFETDSGKTDMTTEKIGANTCWSGDATWAITEARDNDLRLYYSLPIGDAEHPQFKAGSNIWADCFCMPRNAADENNQTPEEKAQYELGEDFIAFMSTPENAVQNCWYTGYTPAVSGEEMLNYQKSCFDVPTMIENYEDYLPTYKEDLAEYSDDDLVYYFSYEGYSVEDCVEFLHEELGIDYTPEDPRFFQKIGRFFKGEVDIDYYYTEELVRDQRDNVIEYMFQSDTSDYVELKEDYENNPDNYVDFDLGYFFQSDDPSNDIIRADKDVAMRELRAQYPTEEDLPKLALMNDFGPDGNQALLDMWEQVKTNPLPGWAIAVFVIEGAAALAFGIYFLTRKVVRRKLKEARV